MDRFEKLKEAALAEPLRILPVERLNVISELSAKKTKIAQQICLRAPVSGADGVPDLIEQLLMRPAMHFKARKSMAAQQALFASEVHIGEFDQVRHLRPESRLAVATRKLLPQLIQRIQQDSVLVIHRRNANGKRLTCCSAHCSFPHVSRLLIGQGGATIPLPWMRGATLVP